MSTLSLTGFLGRIWPAGARYFVSCMRVDAATGKERWVNLPCDDIARAEYEIRRKAQNWNVFHTVAAFKPGATKRKHVDIQSSRCLFLDLDVARPGAVKPNAYPDQRSALAAAITAWRAARLPDPNLYLSSGWGVHVYWILDTDLNPTQWQPLADGLRAEMERYGVHFDGSVTTTMARLLRPPETFNIKDPANRKPVHCFYHENNSVPLSAVQHLASVQPIPRLARPGKGRGPSLNAGITTMNYEPAGAEPVIRNCPVLRQMALTQSAPGSGFDDRELWLAMLATMVATADPGNGYLLARHMSEKHHSFSAVDFDRQWHITHEKNMGPGLCATFARFRPECSTTCPFAGRVTTPLQLGTPRFQTAPAAPVSAPPSAMTSLGLVVAPPMPNPLPVPPPPFVVDPTGWWILAPGEEPGSFTRVMNGQISAIALDTNLKGEDELHLTYRSSPTSPARPVKLPIMSMTTKNEGFFRGHGLSGMFSPREGVHMFGSWQHQLSQAATSRQYFETDRFGWHDDGFAAGENIFWPDGRVEAVRPRVMFAHFKPIGDLHVWQNAAQQILDALSLPLQIAVAASFAAPLVALSGEPGSRVLSLRSTLTGNGKSTTAALAISVWGDTIEGMLKLNATANASTAFLGNMHSLPVYWDDIRGNDYDSFKDTLLQYADGVGRRRMTQSAVLQNSQSWQTFMVIMSNAGTLDRATLQERVQQSGAGPFAARVFEMAVPDVTQRIDALHGLSRQVRQNYGHAGQAYARYLVTHRGEIERQVTGLETTSRQQLSNAGAYRQHVSAIALLTLGAFHATQAGILRFDHTALWRYLITEWKRQTAPANAEIASPLQPLTVDRETHAFNVLDRFMVAHDHRTIVTIAAQPIRPGKPARPVIVKAPQMNGHTRWDGERGLAVHWILNEQVMLIHHAVLDEWLIRQGYSKDETLSLLKQVFGCSKVQRTLAAGTLHSRMRSWCYAINCQHPELHAKMADFDIPPAMTGAPSLTMPSVH